MLTATRVLYILSMSLNIGILLFLFVFGGWDVLWESMPNELAHNKDMTSLVYIISTSISIVIAFAFFIATFFIKTRFHAIILAVISLVMGSILPGVLLLFAKFEESNKVINNEQQ